MKVTKLMDRIDKTAIVPIANTIRMVTKLTIVSKNKTFSRINTVFKVRLVDS